jgi:hypothetical protein
MSYFNFDQEATASWSDKPIYGDVHGGPGNVRPFKTLREALNFVKDMEPRLRKNAFVMTESMTYSGDEIDELLAQMKAQVGA